MSHDIPSAPRELRVGVVDPSDAVMDACEGAFAESWAVVRVTADDRGHIEEGAECDVLVVGLEPPMAEAVARFDRIRAANPVAPILLVAGGIDVDLAVELLAFGAADLATLPVQPGVLRRKVERALGRHSGPTLEREEVASLSRPTGTKPGAERRRAVRATVPAWHATRARLRLADRRLVAIVVDLSIPTEGGDGGMLLRVDPATAREIPFASWSAEEPIELWVDLPDEERPVEVDARFVPGLRKGPARFVDFAVRYAEVDDRIRRYWSAVR